jgi:hypothetical protein
MPEERAALGLPLFLSFAAVGGILLFEGVEFLPQTILPVWLVWALAEVWLKQASLPTGRPPARRVARSRRNPAVRSHVFPTRAISWTCR